MAPMADISQIFCQGMTPASSLHFPFSTDRYHRLDTYNGSAAIAAVVQRMELGPNDQVLLPAYCCGAELGPFRHAGCQIVFYDINTDLSVNREQINSLLNRHPNIRLLFITHYFGLPQPDMQNLARWCENNQITLVEDCAHALYGRSHEGTLGRFGEYAVFSQRKFLPVSEAGLLVFREKGFEQFDTGQQKPAPLIPGLDRLVYSISQHQRRMNYNYWLQAIAPLSGLEALIAELPEGMCPLYFPVKAATETTDTSYGQHSSQ